MTTDELRAQWNEAYRIIWRERRAWAAVAEKGHAVGLEKMKEMDRLLEIMTGFKDELKEVMEAQPTQPRMLDAPQRAKYG